MQAHKNRIAPRRRLRLGRQRGIRPGAEQGSKRQSEESRSNFSFRWAGARRAMATALVPINSLLTIQQAERCRAVATESPFTASAGSQAI